VPSLIVFEQWVSKTTDDKSAGLVLNWFLPIADEQYFDEVQAEHQEFGYSDNKIELQNL